MSISVGSQLGAYEITALLGEGGMGRVFRARDTRLKRDVAIKALPDEFALDAERTARFRREAEALAALNHPHIGGIHDVLESSGSQFLVLELVDGETLAERIRRGPIPIVEATAIARQIAEALEAAHERGIVHRDLKPANVKITADGRVKVLDFGLAKDLEARHTGAASLTHSPTFVGGATKAGVILGTAAYMSPEQARGLGVGAQADVWALGCVLYEMLTGRQPFNGPTVTDVLAAVVRGEPDWSALPAETPSGVRSLLRRCLQKDLSRRLQHIGDARIELEDAQADPAASATAGRSTPRTRDRWAWTLVTALTLIAAIMSVALALALRPDPPPPEMRVEISTPPSPDPLSLTISPDGQKLVFLATADGTSRLWLRSLSGTAAQPIAGTELATAPFWSPDSRTLGFFADGKLKRLDIAGGLTQVLASAPIGGGGTWSRDGVIVYAPSIVGSLLRVPASGGAAVPVTQLTKNQNAHRFPQFLPDGRHFLFFSGGTSDTKGIYLGSLDGSTPRRLMDADVAGAVTSSGHLLFSREGTLFAQAFDDRGLALGGDPVAVADRLAYDGNMNLAAFTTSAAGPIAYRVGGASGQRQLVWFDRSGRNVGTLGGADAAALFNPDLSPDGRFAAVNRTVDNNQDIWIVEVARGILRRFTFDADSDQLPVWSPDGKQVVFSSARKGSFNLYQRPASAPGIEQLLLESPENKFGMSFSPDGRFLLYRNTGPNTNWDLWVLPLTGDKKPFPVVKTAFQEMMGEFSPDSRWIAYQSNESGHYEVYAQSFPESNARTQISTSGGSQPRWGRDGKKLFYIALDGKLMAAPITVGANGLIDVSTPAPLFMTRVAGGAVPNAQKQQYAVSPEGQRFLFNSLTDEASASPITLVLNWRPPVAK